MNREIKFRVWDELLNSMFDWDECNEGQSVLFDAFKGDSAVALQYTGVTDKNGVEIYEGDIVSVDYDSGGSVTRHQVTWGGCDYPAFDLQPHLECDPNAFSEIMCGDDYTIEVIGNIYENPELLEVANA